MKKQEILKEIADGLECLVAENPRTLKLMLDYYVDTYYEDSISALILKWNQSGYENFDNLFPITAKLVAELDSVNDWIDRPLEVYEDIINLAKKASSEIQNYIAELSK